MYEKKYIYNDQHITHSVILILSELLMLSILNLFLNYRVYGIIYFLMQIILLIFLYKRLKPVEKKYYKQNIIFHFELKQNIKPWIGYT